MCFPRLLCQRQPPRPGAATTLRGRGIRGTAAPSESRPTREVTSPHVSPRQAGEHSGKHDDLEEAAWCPVSAQTGAASRVCNCRQLTVPGARCQLVPRLVRRGERPEASGGLFSVSEELSGRQGAGEPWGLADDFRGPDAPFQGRRTRPTWLLLSAPVRKGAVLFLQHPKLADSSDVQAGSLGFELRHACCLA